MPQRIDYPYVQGKGWDWHLRLLQEWLHLVAAGTSERKYTKWLRAQKVFDRGFIRLVEVFLGIEHRRGSKPRLGEVGEELLEELERAEEQRQAAVDALAERKAIHGEEWAAPTADDDPFLKALVERFAELNPYLCMFAAKEIGDDFMAPNELFNRIGSNDFQGRRPSKPHFDQWVHWLEWLGFLRRVGFRHKLTKAGSEVGAFYKELPAEELLDDEEAEGEEEAEQPAAASAPAPKGPRRRPRARDVDEADEDDEAAPDDEDDLDLEEEGLDLPPAPEPAPDVEEGERYWEATGPRRRRILPRPDAKGSDGAPAAEAPDRTRAPSVSEASPAAEAPGRTRAPSVSEASPAAEAPDRTRAPSVSEASPAATRPADPGPRAPAPPADGAGAPAEPLLSSRHLRRIVHDWLDEDGAVTAASAGIALGPHPSGKPVGLFQLLVLASLLEADAPPREAVTVFRAVVGAAERYLVAEEPLESVLEAAWRADPPPALEERLVHLPRYRAGLARLSEEELAAAPDARALGRLLRERVTGATLGPGLVFTIRELATHGLWEPSGLESVSWLRWPISTPAD